MAWQADIFRRKVEPSSAADRSGSRLTQVEDWDRFRLRAAVAPDSREGRSVVGQRRNRRARSHPWALRALSFV